MTTQYFIRLGVVGVSFTRDQRSAEIQVCVCVCFSTLLALITNTGPVRVYVLVCVCMCACVAAFSSNGLNVIYCVLLYSVVRLFRFRRADLDCVPEFGAMVYM